MFHWDDQERVDRLLAWMGDKRHFVIEESQLRSRFGGFTGDIEAIMEELLCFGGVVLWLMGEGSVRIADAFFSQDFVDATREDSETITHEALTDIFSLDGAPQEDLDNAYYRLYDLVGSVFARIDPALPADWRVDPFPGQTAKLFETATGHPPPIYDVIDLLEGTTSDTDFNWNRIDDLIIRLYAQLI